jgi:hypothetical protein
MVSDQADNMAPLGPASYVMLLIRLEKQRQDLQLFLSPSCEDRENPSSLVALACKFGMNMDKAIP